MVTTKMVRAALGPDMVSMKSGVFTIRNGFFYRHGHTSDMEVARVKRAFPTAVIVDSGEVWKPFRGGASTAASSHWYVKFSVPAEPDYDGEGIRTDLRPRASGL